MEKHTRRRDGLVERMLRHTGLFLPWSKDQKRRRTQEAEEDWNTWNRLIWTRNVKIVQMCLAENRWGWRVVFYQSVFQSDNERERNLEVWAGDALIKWNENVVSAVTFVWNLYLKIRHLKSSIPVLKKAIRFKWTRTVMWLAVLWKKLVIKFTESVTVKGKL